MTEPEENTPRTSSIWSIIGLSLAFVALVAAVMSPWIMEALAPPRKPVDEVVADVAGRLKDRMIAKVKGQEFVPPPVEEPAFDISKWYPPGTIGIGAIAMCLGVVGFTRHESLRISSSAVMVGLAAILFQYFLLLAAVLIFLLLVMLALSALGIPLPL